MDLQTYWEWHRSALQEQGEADHERLRQALALTPEPDAVTATPTPLQTVRTIVVHHSETPSGNVQLFRWLHRLSNGWNDVGYHFVMGNGDGSPAGHIEAGRPETAVGAHVAGHNADSLGFCLVGNYDQAEPPPHLAEALAESLASLAQRYGIAVAKIRGHREFPGVTKTCPGARFDMESLRRQVAKRLKEAS